MIRRRFQLVSFDAKTLRQHFCFLNFYPKPTIYLAIELAQTTT